MILTRLITGRQPCNFILVKENDSNSAHHLLRKIIGDNLSMGNLVHVFSYTNTRFSCFASVTSSFLRVHRCFDDPWCLSAKNENVSVEDKSWFSQLITDQINVVIIDSLSYALMNHQLEALCGAFRNLKALNNNSIRTQVIVVMDVSVVKTESLEYQEMNKLAEAVVTLSPLPSTSLFTVIYRKPLGKLIKGTYEMTLSGDGEVKFSDKSNKELVVSKPQVTTPQVTTTFRLELDDKEMASRKSVVLPYLKNSRSGGGKIIYEPDANDDWDDEDPDDDLEI